MRKLVSFRDSSGLPRAWGLAPTEAAAKEAAIVQLDRYLTKRLEVGESYRVEDFTMHVEDVVEQIDLTEKQRALLARLVAKGGAYVVGGEVRTARALAAKGLAGLEDDGPGGNKQNFQGQRWFLTITPRGSVLARDAALAKALEGER